MKLYTLTLADGTKQEVIARRVSQAIAAARLPVYGYTATAEWAEC